MRGLGVLALSPYCGLSRSVVDSIHSPRPEAEGQKQLSHIHPHQVPWGGRLGRAHSRETGKEWEALDSEGGGGRAGRALGQPERGHAAVPAEKLREWGGRTVRRHTQIPVPLHLDGLTVLLELVGRVSRRQHGPQEVSAVQHSWILISEGNTSQMHKPKNEQLTKRNVLACETRKDRESKGLEQHSHFVYFVFCVCLVPVVLLLFSVCGFLLMVRTRFPHVAGIAPSSGLTLSQHPREGLRGKRRLSLLSGITLVPALKFCLLPLMLCAHDCEWQLHPRWAVQKTISPPKMWRGFAVTRRQGSEG